MQCYHSLLILFLSLNLEISHWQGCKRECWHKRPQMKCHLIKSIQPSEVLLWSRVKAQSDNGLTIRRTRNFGLLGDKLSKKMRSAGELNSASASTTELCWANYLSCCCLLAPSTFYTFRLGWQGIACGQKEVSISQDHLQYKLLLIIKSKVKSVCDRLQWLLDVHPRDAHDFPVHGVWWGTLCTWWLSPP